MYLIYIYISYPIRFHTSTHVPPQTKKHNPFLSTEPVKAAVAIGKGSFGHQDSSSWISGDLFCEGWRLVFKHDSNFPNIDVLSLSISCFHHFQHLRRDLKVFIWIFVCCLFWDAVIFRI